MHRIFPETEKAGRIRYLGFSSHAGVEALIKMADHHHWDFSQLQLNYFDWQHKTTAKEYNVLEEREIPIMVMEPARGAGLQYFPVKRRKCLRLTIPVGVWHPGCCGG